MMNPSNLSWNTEELSIHTIYLASTPPLGLPHPEVAPRTAPSGAYTTQRWSLGLARVCPSHYRCRTYVHIYRRSHAAYAWTTLQVFNVADTAGYAAVATTVNKVIIVITAGYAVAITTVQRSNVRSRMRKYKSNMSILILKIHKR